MQYMIELTEPQYDRLQKCFEFIGWQKQLTPLNQLGHFYSDERIQQIKAEARDNWFDEGYKAYQIELKRKSIEVGDEIIYKVNDLKGIVTRIRPAANTIVLEVMFTDGAVYDDVVPSECIRTGNNYASALQQLIANLKE